MIESAYLPGLAIQTSTSLDSSRHPAFVRITHWINALSFFALLVSGGMILVAHPRLYWGETGGWGTPSLIDLPIPFKLGYSGWGRYLHFLSAWVCILTGALYVVTGLAAGHFRKKWLPARAELGWVAMWQAVASHLRLRRPGEKEAARYSAPQKLTYLAVVFVLFPLIVLTGFAMSPAITSVLPVLVTMFGGQQSARTLHFFASFMLVLFFVVHIAMISLAGFTSKVRAMITGRSAYE